MLKNCKHVTAHKLAEKGSKIPEKRGVFFPNPLAGIVTRWQCTISLSPRSLDETVEIGIHSHSQSGRRRNFCKGTESHAPDFGVRKAGGGRQEKEGERNKWVTGERGPSCLLVRLLSSLFLRLLPHFVFNATALLLDLAHPPRPPPPQLILVPGSPRFSCSFGIASSFAASASQQHPRAAAWNKVGSWLSF